MFLWQCDGQKLWATCMIGDMEYMYKYGEMYDRSGCPAGYIATKKEQAMPSMQDNDHITRANTACDKEIHVTKQVT